MKCYHYNTSTVHLEITNLITYLQTSHIEHILKTRDHWQTKAVSLASLQGPLLLEYLTTATITCDQAL